MVRICLMAVVLVVGRTGWSQNPLVRPGEAAVVVPSTQPQAATVGALMQRHGGSLLKATLSARPDPGQARLATVSLYAVPEPQPRTLKKHDLVTIIVREESEFSSQGSTDLKKEMAFEAKLEEWIRLKLRNAAIQGGAEGSAAPSIKFSGTRDFKGEATVDRADSFTARITAEVVDVKPNGTLVLQARKRIRTDEEEQQFILTGTCRVEDVSADNTLLSTQLYDLELQKNHKGAVRDSTKRGAVPRLLDFINPF